MATYPTSLDVFTNPDATDPLDDPSHSAQHSDANDAIEELEVKLGVGASTPAAGKVLLGVDAGESEWVAGSESKGARFFRPHASLSDAGSIYFERAVTLIGWVVLNDVPGSVVFDVWSDSYGSYPPDVTDTITASDKPLTSSSIKGKGTCSGWDVDVDADTTLYIVVDTTATGGIRWSDVRLIYTYAG